MNKRTTTALQALFEAIKDNGELVLLYGAVQDAVESEIGSYAERNVQYRDSRVSVLNEVAFQRVLERAMAADPRATELDLIEAGARTTAAELGDWQAAEDHRRRERERQRVVQSELALG